MFGDVALGTVVELMHKVHEDQLWVGNAFDARDPRQLFDNGIKAVFDVAYEEAPAQLPREFIYCRFPLNDGGGNPEELLLLALSTLTRLLKSKTSTLVACSAGMSRSPTIAGFALAHHLGEKPLEVLSHIGGVKTLELKQVLLDDFSNAFSRLES